VSLPDEPDEYGGTVGDGSHASLNDRVLLIAERLRDVRRRLSQAERTIEQNAHTLDSHEWQIKSLSARPQNGPNKAPQGETVHQFLRIIIFALLGIIGTLATGKALDVAGLFP
jgi:hypothetical protein